MSRLTKFVLMVWVGLGCAMTTSAQPFETVYSFGNGPANPRGNLTLGPDGNFYGTTASGGQYGGGTVFRVTTNGVLTTLISFGGYPNGSGPYAGLTLGADGNFYGTTIAGGTNQVSGTNNTGTIFRVTTNGTLTTVVSFTGFNGSYPECKLTIGPNGCFYGTTAYGGSSNAGTVFQATTNGILTTMASFSGTNGAMPQAGLTLGLDGNFYGTTVYGGGTNNLGTVFRVTTNGNLTTLVMFTGKYYTNNVEVFANGIRPYGQLILGTDGNLYGTTAFGGNPNGDFSGGTVFQVTTNGVLTTLIYFSAFGGINGDSSYAQLIQGADGNFYGTTSSGGVNGSGTVFQVTTNGTLAQLANLPGFQYIVVTNSQGAVYLNYTTNNWTNVLVALDLNGSVKKLYDFPPLVNSTNSTGADAQSGLTLGPDGNFYTAVYKGGASGYGTVIRIATNGTTTPLASFSGNTGSGLHAGLTLGPDGCLYGAAQAGGVNGYGTLFKWSPAGSLSTLHNFDYQPDGANPNASLTLGPDGNLYGTALNGGTNLVQVGPNSYNAVSDGTVFRVTTNGVFTPVVYFNGTNGANPYGALTLLGDGNFYGTTAYGGISNSGTVFQVTTNGTLTVLGSFTGANGSHPDGKLTAGPNGNLYGTTVFGGVSNVGTVFEISTQGIINTVLDFTGTNGADPEAGLLWNSDGYFYGSTVGGGSKNIGTVFKLTPGGTLTTLVNFGLMNGANVGLMSGADPSGDLIKGPDGNLYGTTSQGGTGYNGTVFRLTTNGTLTTLFSFPSTPFNYASTSGYQPFSGLTLVTNGNFIHLYGTAYGGGNNGGGTIFLVNLSTYYAVTENTSSLLNPLTNDLLWTIGGSLSLVGTSTTNGTATINGTGILILPATNFVGSATLAYTFTDGGQTNTSLIALLVTNIPPIANPDFGTVGENSTANPLNPLANDLVETPGGTLGLVSVSTTNGTAVISGTNVLFTPQTNFTGTATIGYTITDNVGGTNSSLITVTVSNPLADLSLSVSAVPEPVGAGNNLVYWLTVSNAGPATATGIVISNQIPANAVFIEAGGGVAAPLDGILRLNFGPLAPGAIDAAQVIVQPIVAGKLTNVFQVFANETDPVLTNNSAVVVSTVTNTPVIAADLILSLNNQSPVPARVGDFLVYGFTISNAGPSVATGVVFSNQLPASVPFGGAARTNYPLAGIQVYNLGTIAVGANAGVTYLVQPPAITGKLTNVFQVFGDQPDPVLTNNSMTVVSPLTNAPVILGIPGTPYAGSWTPTIITPPFGVDYNSAFFSSIHVGTGVQSFGASFAPLSFNSSPSNAIPGDVVLLLSANGGNNPTNWMAVVRFFNPNDPTGTNGLAATGTQAFFPAMAGASGFANFHLFPDAVFYPGTVIDSQNLLAQFNIVGPAAGVLGGQIDIVVLQVSNSLAEVSLSASATPNPVGVFSNLVYSITVSNAGPSAASGVVVSNQLPANVAFVSASGGATPTNGVLLVNLGSLAEGTTNLVQVVVQPTTAGSLTNNFQVFANESDPNVTNNSAAVVSTVTNAPVVAALAVPGTPIAWTNPGGALLITYSRGFGGNPVPIQTGAGGNPASSGQAGDLVLLINTNGVTAPTNWAAVVRFFNPADPTGSNGLAATYSQAFFATNFGGSGFNGFQLFPVVSYIPEGTVTTNANGLTVFDTTYTQFGPVGGILAGQENIGVVSVFTLTCGVTITSPTTGQVVSNAVLSVTGTATNYINSAVTNVFVQLNGGVWTNATTVNGWTNWSANVTLTPGSNTVSAYAVNGYGSFSPTNSVTFDYATNAPVTADLSLTASTAPEPVGVGSNLVYSISITNQGPNAASGVTVSNQVPVGVTFVSATGGATPSGGILLVNLGALATGVVTNAQVTVQPTAAGKLTNFFQVFATTTDPVLTNNSATVVSTVTNAAVVSADLSLSARAAPEPVIVGSNLVYTIAITNRGPSAASGVVVSNRIPTSVTFVSATGGGTPSGGILLLNLGSLAAGATNSAQIVVQPVVAGKLTNVFEVFASQTDPVLTNNSATVVSTVTNAPPPPVDVALSLMAAPNPVAVGAPLTYSLTVTNNSSTMATGVVVSNTLPPNVTLISVLPSEGSASNHAGVVTYSVGSLPNGNAATLAIVVIPNAAGLLTNIAAAFSAQTDSQPTNNSVTNVTTAVAAPFTNLVLTVLSAITLNPQTGLFEQRIEVSNGGPSTPSSVLVLISGLAGNAKLYNASGTTNGTPFVQSAAPLGVGSNVVFLLEFYVSTRVAPTDLTLTVQAGPPVIPPVVSGTILNISRTVVLSDGSVLVEFSAVPGQVYAIQYSSDMQTWRTAVPAITAPANQVQWIDSGPPKTDSNPAQQSARYYRVVRLTAN